MTITREEFDSLKVGDELKNDRYTLLIEAKYANTIVFIDDEGDSDMLSFKGLQKANYSIKQPIQHNCGFPYGDYSDRECLVKVSDSSIDDCMVNAMYIRLMNVSKAGFQDHNGEYWMYAVLVSNNVDLVKPWTNY